METMQVRRGVGAAHVQAWQDSGLTQVAYCQQHALNPKTLARWIRRARQVDSPLTLLPLTVRDPVAGGELLLRHASGWQLVLPAAVEAAWLAGLLRGMA